MECFLFIFNLQIMSTNLFSRGMTSEHMETVVSLIHSALQLGVQIQTSSGPKLADFRAACKTPTWSEKISSVQTQVEKFSVQFMLPGRDESEL